MKFPLDTLHTMGVLLHTVKKLADGGSRTISVRIPIDWWDRLVKMTDEKNPMRELVREAIRRFLRI